MRITPVVAVLAFVTLAGCAHVAAPTWQRPAELTRYTFVSTEERPDGRNRLEVDVELQGRRDAPEILTITGIRAGPSETAATPVALTNECSAEFGGGNGALGRVVMAANIDPHAAVPQCVPEHVFGGVTDLIAILLVQTPAFSIGALANPGDSARFAGFETGWTRANPEVRARVAAPGGTIRLVERTPTRGVVRWKPDSMAIAIARRLAPGQALLLRGHEHFELELVIDPRTGALHRATAVEDRLNLHMWMLQSAELPELDELPKQPGMPLVLLRTLSLERQ